MSIIIPKKHHLEIYIAEEDLLHDLFPAHRIKLLYLPRAILLISNYIFLQIFSILHHFFHSNLMFTVLCIMIPNGSSPLFINACHNASTEIYPGIGYSQEIISHLHIHLLLYSIHQSEFLLHHKYCHNTQKC